VGRKPFHENVAVALAENASWSRTNREFAQPDAARRNLRHRALDIRNARSFGSTRYPRRRRLGLAITAAAKFW